MKRRLCALLSGRFLVRLLAITFKTLRFFAIVLALTQNSKANKPLNDSTIRHLVEVNRSYIYPTVAGAHDRNSIIRLLDMFDSITDPELKGDAAYVIGHYYMHMFDMQNALKNFSLSAKMYERANQWGKYLNVTKDFCNANRSSGNYVIIEPLLRKCLEIAKKHNVGFYVLDPLHELTIQLSYTDKNYTEAIRYGQMFMDTLEKYERMNIVNRDFEFSRTVDRAIIELELGHSYLELGNQPKALFYLAHAEAFFKPTRDYEKLMRVYRHLTVLAQKQNQRDSLICYLAQFDYYRIADARKETAIFYGVPRLTRSVQSLREAYLKNEREVKLLTKWNYYSLALFSLISLIVGFVLWTHRKSRVDQSKITELLKRDFDRSQQLSVEKTKYFSILSHELRTPIFVITGLAKLLDGPAGNSQENIDAIINSGNHLLHLVNNVLQHNKLEESGQVSLDEVNFELTQAITEALQTTSYLGSQRNIGVIFHNRLTGPQFLNGDKQKLIQILVNLISNSIRYSHRDNKVEVSVNAIGSSDTCNAFHFSIRDHGTGIEPAQIPLLFDYRKTTYELESTGDDHLKGMGIGLFVVANFVKAMGSEIFVESSPGRGSEFYFDLRFKLGQRVFVPSNTVERTNTDVKIMVVDDIRINLIVTQKTLSTLGLACVTATDADPVIEMITRENIDLVLMDLNMPLITGYELSKKIRQAGIFIPIIAHTAVIQENIDHKALEDAEIHDFLIKPYPIEDLKEKLTKHLNISF